MEIATQILHAAEAVALFGQGMGGMRTDLERGLEAMATLTSLYSLLEKFLLITPDPVPETPPPGSLPACPSRQPCFFSALSQTTSSSGPGPDLPHQICDLKTKGCPSPRTPG